MKKIMFCVLMIIAATCIFAQSYVVDEVTGRVEKETGSGKWELIKAGDKLSADTIIKTGMGSTLKVKLDDKVLTVPPVKNGKLGELAGSSNAVQIQSRVSQTDTAEVSRSSASAVTASARASNAAADLEVAEE